MARVIVDGGQHEIYVLGLHHRDQLPQMLGARWYARFGFQASDFLDTQPTPEVSPALMLADNLGIFQPGCLLLPVADSRVEA